MNAIGLPPTQNIPSDRKGDFTEISSLDWPRIAAASLLATTAIGVLAWAISSYEAPLPMDPFKNEPIELNPYLSALCKKSVKNIQLQNPIERLGDISDSSLWKVSAFLENTSPLPVCLVTIDHKNCDSITDRYINTDRTESLNRGWIYYGELYRKLTSEERKDPHMTWLKYSSNMGQDPESFGFKTRVSCSQV